MDRMGIVLELLNTLIHSTMDNTIMIDKAIVANIQICLKNVQENIEFLQLESQLQQEELKQRSHSEPVSVQKIETDSHKQKVNNVPAAIVQANAETQSALPKPIIRPWEQLVHNKHKIGLGYDKDLSFHIPDYAKPI